MPQKCKVCAHPKTRKMEEDYVNGIAKTQIARTYDVPTQSVDYHMDNHLTQKLVQSVQDKKADHAKGILDGIENMLDETRDILKDAKADGQKRLALDAIGQGTRIFELLSKIAVKLAEYQKKDEDKDNAITDSYTSEGLQYLSDIELKVLMELIAKVHSHDANHDLSPNVQMFVDTVDRNNEYNNKVSSIDKVDDGDSPEYKMKRNRFKEARNTHESGSTTPSNKVDEFDEYDEDDFDDFDDWDDLDNLELNDEPEWLKKERADKYPFS